MFPAKTSDREQTERNLLGPNPDAAISPWISRLRDLRLWNSCLLFSYGHASIHLRLNFDSVSDLLVPYDAYSRQLQMAFHFMPLLAISYTCFVGI